MAQAVVYWIDVESIYSTAAAQPAGSRRLSYNTAMAAALGSAPRFTIVSGGVTVYQALFTGPVTATASGMFCPGLAAPTVNTASTSAVLSDPSCVMVVANASNLKNRVTVPLSAVADAAKLLISPVLDGVAAVSLAFGAMLPPALLDDGTTPPPAPTPAPTPTPTPTPTPSPTPTPAPTPSPSGQTSIAAALYRSMFEPNSNGWLAAINGNLTNDSNGPTTNGKQHYGYASRAILNADKSASGQNFWGNIASMEDAFGRNSSTQLFIRSWFLIADAAQAGNTAPNTRVLMLNHRLCHLLRNGTWTTPTFHPLTVTPQWLADWYATLSSPGNEQTQPPVYRSSYSGASLHDIVTEAIGRSVGGVGYGARDGWVFHGYFPDSSTRTVKQWGDEIRGTVQTMEAQLILHNKQGNDDRANANLLMWMGGDYYQGGDWQNEFAHSSLDIITTTRKTFGVTDLPSSIILANPPPIPLASG